jgi:TrmH family RNA methyltransferase
MSSSKHRKQEKSYMIEGLNIVKQAVESKANISLYIMSEDFYNSEMNHLVDSERSVVLSNARFRELTDTVNSQGIMAIINQEPFNQNGIERVLVLNEVQDPGNMGTLVRSADAFGIDTVLITKGSCDIYNPKVIRSTMGSVFHVNLKKDLTNEEAFEILSMNEIKVYTSVLDEEAVKLNSINKREKWALVLGNESRGVNDFWINNSSLKLMIPMFGKAESLNVAIAGSIIMYQLTCLR